MPNLPTVLLLFAVDNVLLSNIVPLVLFVCGCMIKNKYRMGVLERALTSWIITCSGGNISIDNFGDFYTQLKECIAYLRPELCHILVEV